MRHNDLKIEAIDMFCGIGGLTYGIQETNDINVIAGLDNDVSCQNPYEKNNDAIFINADISDYDFNELAKLHSNDSIRILVGCAPCQPFSTHTTKCKNKKKDIRWNLINYFVEAIQIIKPHVVSMENVRGIVKTKVFNNFLTSLNDLGYKVDYKVVYCPNYGIPQNRSRLILLASRLGEITLPKITHEKEEYVTMADVIQHLPTIKSGETGVGDPLHQAANLSPLNLKRIKQSKPGGTWRDWNKNLLPNCYKKESGQTYASVYGRASWDKVSPTITTQFFNYGTGRFGHPEQDRALSIREGALLQTFPKKYDFGKIISLSRTARHIGNAVPPRLGFVIGKTILKHLENIS